MWQSPPLGSSSNGATLTPDKTPRPTAVRTIQHTTRKSDERRTVHGAGTPFRARSSGTLTDRNEIDTLPMIYEDLAPEGTHTGDHMDVDMGDTSTGSNLLPRVDDTPSVGPSVITLDSPVTPEKKRCVTDDTGVERAPVGVARNTVDASTLPIDDTNSQLAETQPGLDPYESDSITPSVGPVELVKPVEPVWEPGQLGCSGSPDVASVPYHDIEDGIASLELEANGCDLGHVSHSMARSSQFKPNSRFVYLPTADGDSVCVDLERDGLVVPRQETQPSRPTQPIWPSVQTNDQFPVLPLSEPSRNIMKRQAVEHTPRPPASSARAKQSCRGREVVWCESQFVRHHTGRPLFLTEGDAHKLWISTVETEQQKFYDNGQWWIIFDLDLGDEQGERDPSSGSSRSRDRSAQRRRLM